MGINFVAFAINPDPAPAEGALQGGSQIGARDACLPGLDFGELRTHDRDLLPAIDAHPFGRAVLAQDGHRLGSQPAQLVVVGSRKTHLDSAA